MFLRLRSAAWCYMQGCLQRANYCIAQWKGRLQPVFAAVPFKLGSSCPTSMRLLWERWFLPCWTRQILNLAKWRSGPYYWSCSLPLAAGYAALCPLVLGGRVDMAGCGDEIMVSLCIPPDVGCVYQGDAVGPCDGEGVSFFVLVETSKDEGSFHDESECVTSLCCFIFVYCLHLRLRLRLRRHHHHHHHHHYHQHQPSSPSSSWLQ